VKGHPERGQRFDGISYVNFGATRDTDMKFWKAEADEVLQKLKHPFASRWDPRRYRRLIECVHDKVDGRLIRECEHIFQAFCQNTVTKLHLSVVMIRLKFG
jgi:hypothetical protein